MTRTFKVKNNGWLHFPSKSLRFTFNREVIKIETTNRAGFGSSVDGDNEEIGGGSPLTVTSTKGDIIKVERQKTGAKITIDGDTPVLADNNFIDPKDVSTPLEELWLELQQLHFGLAENPRRSLDSIKTRIDTITAHQKRKPAIGEALVKVFRKTDDIIVNSGPKNYTLPISRIRGLKTRYPHLFSTELG